MHIDVEQVTNKTLSWEYSSLICKMPLPTKAKEGDPFDFTEHEWETREFKAVSDQKGEELELNDGELFVLSENGRKKSDYTGYLNFFDYIRDNDGDKDLSVEFQAHILMGELDGEIECLLWEKEPNKERIELEEELKKQLEIRLKKVNTWYFNWLLRPWNIVVDLVLTLIAGTFQWMSLKLIKLRDWLMF